MERILIIGCAGAGKTTLSRRLGEKLNLPVVHLDSIFWSPGNWEHLEKEDFDNVCVWNWKSRSGSSRETMTVP